MLFKAKFCDVCSSVFTPLNGRHKRCSLQCISIATRISKRVAKKRRAEANPEKTKEMNAIYAERGRTKKNARSLARYHELAKKAGFTRRKVPEGYMANYVKERRKIDPEFKLKMNLRRRFLHAIKRSKKIHSTISYLGCSIFELRSHLESLFKPGMNWENYSPTGWHIDHKKALYHYRLISEDGTLDEAELQQAFHYTNLQPLWASENLSKNKKLISA